MHADKLSDCVGTLSVFFGPHIVVVYITTGDDSGIRTATNNTT